MKTVYLGMTHAAGMQIIIVASEQRTAERKLYRLWRETVYAGFQPEIRNFSALNEWNGATVKRVTVDTAVVWEQL